MARKPVSQSKKSKSKSKFNSKDHLSKTEKKEVKEIINGKPEVKYFTSGNNNYNLSVFPGAQTPLASGGPFSTATGGFLSLLAQCPAGTGPNERIGLRITPVKAKCTWTFSLVNPGTNGGSGISGPQNFIVNLYVVEPKGYNNITTIASIPPGEFLLNGNGTCSDPNVPSNLDQTKMLQVINNLPVNKNLYKVKMHKKFHISKNAGNQNLNPYTTTPEYGNQNTPQDNSVQTVTFEWKPPKFKYNLPTDTLPNNHNPLFLVWATPVDGARFPTNNGGTGPDIGMLTYGYRIEYWFTDT